MNLSNLRETSVLTRTTNTGITYARILSRIKQEPPFRGAFHHPSMVLDFGTGYGNGIPALETHYPTATIHAHDLVHPLEWRHSRGLLIDFLPEEPTYGLVLAIYVLNVLPLVDRLDAVMEIYDILLPGGIALFCVRPWHDDVSRTKQYDLTPERNGILTKHGNVDTFQKGYLPLELESELEWFFSKHPDVEVHALPRRDPSRGMTSYIHKKEVP